MDKEDVVLYTMEYYSAIKENEIMPLAAIWVDLESIILNKVRQRQIPYITYMCNLKYDTNELIYNRNRLTDIENKLMVTKGERGLGIN